MIVELTVPLSTTRVNYGAARMLPDADHTLQVPAYVAKTLLTLPGVTGPALSDSAMTLLTASEDDFECNYIFMAYSRPLPSSDLASAAAELLTENGEPTVSAA